MEWQQEYMLKVWKTYPKESQQVYPLIGSNKCTRHRADVKVYQTSTQTSRMSSETNRALKRWCNNSRTVICAELVQFIYPASSEWDTLQPELCQPKQFHGRLEVVSATSS